MGMAAAAEVRVRPTEIADDPPYTSGGEEKAMNASATTSPNASKYGADLRFWRIVVFGGVGALYLVSLFVPPLREALARLFSYFPQ